MAAVTERILAPNDIIVDRRELDRIIDSLRDGAEKYRDFRARREWSMACGYCGRACELNHDALKKMRDRAEERGK